jgi:hypothetical protein
MVLRLLAVGGAKAEPGPQRADDGGPVDPEGRGEGGPTDGLLARLALEGGGGNGAHTIAPLGVLGAAGGALEDALGFAEGEAGAEQEAGGAEGGLVPGAFSGPRPREECRAGEVGTAAAQLVGIDRGRRLVLGPRDGLVVGMLGGREEGLGARAAELEEHAAALVALADRGNVGRGGEAGRHVEPVGGRSRGPAELRSRVGQELIREAEHLRGVEIDVDEIPGGFAEEDADIDGAAGEMLGELGLGEAPRLPRLTAGVLRPVRHGNRVPAPAEVDAGRIERGDHGVGLRRVGQVAGQPSRIAGVLQTHSSPGSQTRAVGG